MKNQQQQMMQNQQMQRDGSQMDMNQRPQSPGSAENAPSPNKRPRLENGFNGQQMGPGARSQGMQPQQMGATSAAQAGQMLMANGIDPNNMTPQQFSAFQGQNPNVQTAKGLQVYAQNLALQHKAALNNQQLAKEMNNAGMQNSPMAQQGGDGSQDFFQGNANARMQPGAPGQQPGGNHALQDYQMQLMLLEQQNKKRLLMARQEQDNITQHPASGPVGQPGFPPAMSPQGSRAGPSPNPNDQMKRGTPKLPQAGLPGSPMPDGPMPQNRSSPLPNGFDPNQMPPGMPPQFYQGQMGANGMMRPPSSHPGFQGQMTPQQMEMIARNGGRMPNGMWPQGGPPQMMPGQQQQGPQQGMQQGQQQQPPMGTPQQRNQQMPPPPAPAAGNENGRTQPSSPAQPQNQPPTPSQANKPNPKNKKKDDKKVSKELCGSSYECVLIRIRLLRPSRRPAAPETRRVQQRALLRLPTPRILRQHQRPVRHLRPCNKRNRLVTLLQQLNNQTLSSSNPQLPQTSLPRCLLNLPWIPMPMLPLETLATTT